VEDSKNLSNSKSCPKGHGKLKRWEGELRCWSCGWPDLKKKETNSSAGGFLSILLRRFFWFLLTGFFGFYGLYKEVNLPPGEDILIPAVVGCLAIAGCSLFIAYEIFQILCAGPKRFRDVKTWVF
jgi:hypothetical protein